MDEIDVESYLLFLLAGAVIWLIVKLQKEKKAALGLVKENQALIAENVILEADQLKYQLQPHTLNNVLANLKVFASKLNKGMDSLSGTLDYILYKGNRNLVSVKDEIGFIETYLELHDLFTHEIDAVRFQPQVDTTSAFYESPCIPHLVSAYFLENAFKHGDTRHPEFLNIEVQLTANCFRFSVVNKIGANGHSKDPGLGLKNMKNRLELLHADKFEIIQRCNEHEYQSVLVINL